MPVNLTFQTSHTLTVQEEGVEIRLPVDFDPTVRTPSSANITITPDTMSPITNLSYGFLKSDNGGVITDNIVLFLPFGYEGTMTVEGVGTMFRTDTGAYDTINTGSALLVYDTREPELVFSDLPTLYEPGDLTSADFVVGFNRNVTFDVSDPGNADTVFLFDGPYFGSAPGLYRYTGTGQPRLPLPADLMTATEWALMRRNDYGKYFAVRFSQVPDIARGTLNITLKADVPVTPDNEDSLLAVSAPPPVPQPQQQSPPIIEKITTQFLTLTEDFEVIINITGPNATEARVRGLALKSNYDFDQANQQIIIRGNANKLITDGTWRCEARRNNRIADPVNQIYNYVQLTPVVTSLGKQEVLIGFFNQFFIPISNGPNDGAVTTELAGFDYELVDRSGDGVMDHMRIYGTVPDNNYSVDRGIFSVTGTNTGGDHTAETEFDLLNAKVYVAGIDNSNDVIKVYDTSNSNAQVGGNIALGSGDWRSIAMSGSLVAGIDNSNDVIKVYDTSNSNAQVGGNIALGSGNWLGIAMSGPLVAGIDRTNWVIKVFDTDNNNAQVGGNIALGSGNWESIAMSGSLVAGIDNSNNVIKVYDTDNSNAQVGGNIALGSGNWLGIAMSGPLVAGIDRTNWVIKVYDTSNSNAQVGGNIALGSGDWRSIAMSGSLVAGIDNSNDVIKVYDTDNSNAQVGGNIALGSGEWLGIAMSGPLVAGIDNSNWVIKVFDTDNSNAQVGGNIALGSGNWLGIAMGIVKS